MQQWGVLLLICFSISHLHAQTDKEQIVPTGESYVSLSEDGAWCWFSDPRAVYFKGEHERTYAGWMDHHGNVVIGYFDHKTKTIASHILHQNLEMDDHDHPAIFISNEGLITVFYSKHASKEPIYLLQSAKPEAITEWLPRRELTLNDTETYAGFRDSYTYTNVYQLSDEENTLYLFWRGMDFKPNFSVSHDNGRTWTKGKILILPERAYRDRRPYIKFASNGKDKIHFAFTDGHPRREPTNSIYYACYQKSAIYKANGKKIMNWSDVPVDPRQADIVYDASKTCEKAWIWDVSEDALGFPVIAYVRFPDDSNHVYYYARWDGTQWQNHKLVNSGGWFPQTPSGKVEPEPNYSGGIVLDHDNPSIVYLSRKIHEKFEIEKWTTQDGGAHWITESITQNSMHDNVRPFAVRGATEKNSVQVLWMHIDHYIHYTDYQSSIKINVKH